MVKEEETEKKGKENDEKEKKEPDPKVGYFKLVSTFTGGTAFFNTNIFNTL